MNDGSAFPFVMLGMGLLGLHDVGDYGLRWVWMEVLWATGAGIAIGVVSGVALARLGWKLRGGSSESHLIYDFLGLGLIGVVYGFCVLVDAWGFLAVFFAAVALRQTELKLASQDDPAQLQATGPGPENRDLSPATPPTVSEGSLVFKEHLERLSEVVLVLLIGGTLFQNSWSWRAISLALFLFVVARPVSVMVGLLGTRASWRIRGMTSWFGIRGIGSLYYLMYAIQHGIPEPLALELTKLTLIVVTLSIFVHGISVKPLMSHFRRHRKQLPTS